MQFDTSLELKSANYIAEEHKKDLIVLHHTVGGSAKSTAEYWQQDPKRIATAFIIERDGTIYSMFPEKYWAYHIGSKLGNDIDRRSIGIELASEGGLTESNGALYCFGIISPRTKFTGPVYDTGRNWRGFRYFDAYEDAQVMATVDLVNYLCDKYDIPKRYPEDLWGSSNDYYYYTGICSHSHIRADKTDIHPGFPWQQIVKEIS